MKKLLGAGLTLVLVVIFSVTATAQVKKGKTRLLQTKQLMGGLVKPNCAGIGDGLKEAPADDKAWEDLATKAALLNEASYILMDDGRCPDADWANAATALREGSRGGAGESERQRRLGRAGSIQIHDAGLRRLP